MRTRFAPAPTGFLHLGHVVNALHVWGVARARGAQVLLRIEDHDRQRCRQEYEAALLEDLDWLGFLPDIAPPGEFRQGPTRYRQSDNASAYRTAVEQLRAGGHRVYSCNCSRRDLLARTGQPGTGTAELRYDGHCRERVLDHAAACALRVELPAGVERFDDLRLGPQAQEPQVQCGDLLLRDRQGNWTYQFGVVVDDRDQDVDLIIRGMDLLESTGRQLLLGRMLGRTQSPRVLHHPLLLNSGGAKLSKANRDTSVRELRTRGVTSADILGTALHLLGMHGGRPLSLREALNLFSSPV
jgi:glutamyl-tRNA synthetase/glutamyl-Q tRNA(Asp) synthetase